MDQWHENCSRWLPTSATRETVLIYLRPSYHLTVSPVNLGGPSPSADGHKNISNQVRRVGQGKSIGGSW